MDTGAASTNGLVRRRLPFLVGAAGVLVYWITLPRWISLLSLPTVANVSGWLWQPDLTHPLSLLVLAPFRLLPEPWIPFASNVFTAVCAGVVLMLLARSVSLLRHDVWPEGSLRNQPGSDLLSLPSAWMPPVLAVMACGLQLSFWEHATSATGHMIALLAFAYALRCILEFRLDPEQKWLSRCAFIYAAGMTDGWVLLAYLPLLLGSIIWVKGYGPFLNLRFLLRMALWGLVGLSLYLVPPVIQSFSPGVEMGVWMALKAHVREQKQALMMLTGAPFRLLVLTAFVPFVVLAVRWKSHTVQLADENRMGIFITRATGHFVHGFCLIAALWITLDPAFSPRELPLGDPGLVYYYVWALVLGHCAGYVLMFVQHAVRVVGRWLPIAVLGILLGVWPVVLCWRNVPEIRFTNGRGLRLFATELFEDLPEGPSLVLSEDPTRLLLLRGRVALAGEAKDPLLVNTTLLMFPGYQDFLERRYGSRWLSVPALDSRGGITPADLRAMIERIAARGPVVYLHPSAGHYVEPFVDEPNGLTHSLRPWPTNSFDRVALPEAVITNNERLWQRRWASHLYALADRNSGQVDALPGGPGTMLDSLRLGPRRNPTSLRLGSAYSKSLNDWGVRMQQDGRWPEAGAWFARALELNPGNAAAAINLAYNQRHQAGDTSRLGASQVKEWLGEDGQKFGSWWELVGNGGPVDEPSCLFQTGRILLATGNERQAVCAFQRCLELSPGWPAPRVLLAECLNRLGQFQASLKLTDEVESGDELLGGAGFAQLLNCRVSALLGLGRTNDVVECLEDFVSLHGGHSEVLSASARIYAERAQFAEGLDLINALVKRDPDNPELLGRKGLAELRLARFEEAVRTLSKALALSTSDDRLLRLRAVAYIGAGQLEAAREDYLILLKRPGGERVALYALGEIAFQRQQTNAAILYFQAYLTNTVQGTVGYSRASRRLKQLASD